MHGSLLPCVWQGQKDDLLELVQGKLQECLAIGMLGGKVCFIRNVLGCQPL